MKKGKNGFVGFSLQPDIFRPPGLSDSCSTWKELSKNHNFIEIGLVDHEIWKFDRFLWAKSTSQITRSRWSRIGFGKFYAKCDVKNRSNFYISWSTGPILIKLWYLESSFHVEHDSDNSRGLKWIYRWENPKILILDNFWP